MKILRALGLFSAVLVAVLGVSAAGCGSSSSNQSGASALGESCARTADCQSGLVCLANACFRMASPVDAGGAEGGGDAGVTPPTGPHLSQIGETCQTTRDCASGLDCVPSSGGASVCDVVSYGLTASSKTCSGECNSAVDCCELPVGISLNGTNDAGFFTFFNVHNCQDVLQLALGGDASVCAAPAPGTPTAIGCFYYQTYCSCTANTWACTNNRCVYTASCQNSLTNTLGGCPSLTRTRLQLSTTCDMPGNKCHATAGGCSTDAECEGTPVSDVFGATCRGGNCACAASACYLKCAKDIDCQAGYSCDATKKLCAPSTCTNDGQCFSQLGKARAKCNSGTCAISCTNDHDCSPSGDILGQPFNGTVCGSNGFCAPVGCTSDVDCGSSSSAHLFCVTPMMTNVHSAITN